MSRYRKKPAMLAGIVLVTLIFTSQLLSMSLINNVPGSRDNRNGYQPGTISSSAANEIVQLAGSDQIVRYNARNASVVTVPNTAAASNLTLPATTAPATVLDATNTSLKFDQNTYSTNHTIQIDKGFDYPYHASGTTWFNTTESQVMNALKVGTAPVNSYKNLNYGLMETGWVISSVGDQVRVDLNYTGITTITGNQSIRIDMQLKMKFNRTVSMNVWLWDNRNSQGWVKANDNAFIYEGDIGSGDPIERTEAVRDEHAQAIRISSPCINVSLRFTASAPFQAQLFTAKAKIYQTRELPIRANNWVALSFDLRGNALVSGFSMHIRSFSLTSGENLLMSVYRTANTSITLNQIGDTNVAKLLQEPDMGHLISGPTTFTNYAGDKINWFNLSSPVYMTTGSYFVVLSSTVASGSRYSLVVLPWEDNTGAIQRPTAKSYQTVVVSTLNGVNKSWALATVSGSGSLKVVNAAPFKVGMQRGLVPSDVALKLNATVVANWTMSRTLPFSSANYEWGRGIWSATNLNARTTTSTLTIPITWNHAVRASFVYNASSSMLIHAEDPGASLLKLSRDAPLWRLSYQFNKTKYNTTSGSSINWAGLSFNFTFPSDWSVLNVTYPDAVDYYNLIYLSSISTSRKMYPVSQISINGLDPLIQQSTYVSWFTSPNYTKSVETFLRFNSTTFYRSQHFINGDIMSARVYVQTAGGKAVLNGQVNLTIFYPSESQVLTTASTVINSTVGFVTKYNFNDAALHTFAGSAVGRHLARVFWTNGSEAGIYYHDVFKVNYTVSGYHVTEELDEGKNKVSGSLFTGAVGAIPTDIAQVSIDKDVVVPIGINVNQTLGAITFMEFNQTETVFNAGEDVNFNVKLKSTSLGLPYTVQVSVQVVEAFHPDRIIMNLTTAPVVLNYTGSGNSERTLTLSGTFPAVSGVNAPLRNSLFMTRVKVYIEGELATTWDSSKVEKYAVKMDNGNTTDGTVLAVKTNPNYLGTTFSRKFTRANETVFNKKTMFMMLVESSGGVTLPSVLARDFTNSMTSSIKEVTWAPVTGDVLTINNSMTLTGRLYFENGSLINNTAVHVSRYNGTAWENYTVVGSTTNNTLPTSNGTFNGIFRIPSVYNASMAVNFTFDGIPSGPSAVVKTSASVTINITKYAPAFTIKVQASSIVVIGGSHRNLYTFVVNNTGNTTLMFEDFVAIKDPYISGERASWSNEGLLDVAPGTQFIFSMVLTAGNPTNLGQSISTTFLLELHAFSIETKVNLNVTQTFSASIRSADLGSQLESVWYLGYFGAIALLVIVAFFMLKRVSAQAKKPVEVGALAKGKAAARGAELPYTLKKGADLAKADGEKKYKSIDEAMAEVKPDEGKDTAAGDKDSGEEAAGEPDASDAEPTGDAKKEEK